MSVRPVFVVAGVGDRSGTGATIARTFTKEGYRVALIARNASNLNNTAQEIISNGGEAAAFTVNEYSYPTMLGVFDQVKEHRWSSQEHAEVGVALWNASTTPFKTFLDVTEEDLKGSLDANVVAPFAFSRQAILTFQKNSINDFGKHGTLIFTGATASRQGNTQTSAFGALSQSLAKEFGKENIHVAHAIIDSMILTDRTAAIKSGEAQEEFKQNPDIRLSPQSIAASYLYLVNQDRSAWTWEVDLRAAHEKWQIRSNSARLNNPSSTEYEYVDGLQDSSYVHKEAVITAKLDPALSHPAVYRPVPPLG